MLNGALVIEVFTCDRTCDEKLWSFDKARNVLIENKKRYGMRNISPLEFIKYLSYSELQKNSKVVNV